MKSNPPLFDDAPRLTIAELRRRGALVDGSQVGRIRRAGSSSILYHADLNRARDGGELTLEHEHAGRGVFQLVELITIPANRGNGHVWYFQCPQTGRRCRTLYRINDEYLHRAATPHARYRTQTRSRQQRLSDAMRFPIWPEGKRMWTKDYLRYLKEHDRAVAAANRWFEIMRHGWQSNR